jgi:hypothetical protein
MISCKKLALALILASLLTSTSSARMHVDVLRSIGGLPAHIAGAFLTPIGFQQTDAGDYYVFDRRAHAVYTIAGDQPARKIVEIGQEPGRVLDPTAFDLDPKDGTFVIADAPRRQERIQTFTASGSRMGGFTLPGREVPRLVLDTIVLNGIGSLQFTGSSILINQPERDALVTELALDGTPARTFGTLRSTGHEQERDLHLALNAGLPLVDPTGGYFFVFQAGVPVFRKYNASGQLLFERHVEGVELDDYLRRLPTVWPPRRTQDGDLVPVVPPTVRTAGVDRQGNLWISLMVPFTYVYDRSGDKVRTVQFKGADILMPNSLFFTKDGRVLVTPGCYAFASRLSLPAAGG